MIRSRETHRTRERALYALLSEATVRAAARSARMKEEDLRAMLVYPPFRSRYNQYRKAFNLMRTAMGYPEAPLLDALVEPQSAQSAHRHRSETRDGKTA